MTAPGGTLPTERQIQRAILAMCGLAFPRVLIHHSPNGVFLGSAKDKAIRGGCMKGDGTKAGWPDLDFRWACGERGMLMEVKSSTGRLTDSQKALFPRLAEVGWPVTVVRSPAEAFEALRLAGAPWSGVKWNG